MQEMLRYTKARRLIQSSGLGTDLETVEENRHRSAIFSERNRNSYKQNITILESRWVRLCTLTYMGVHFRACESFRRCMTEAPASQAKKVQEQVCDTCDTVRKVKWRQTRDLDCCPRVWG